MNLKDVKDALVYANVIIKESNTDVPQVNDPSIEKILEHTCAYVKEKKECDLKTIQNLLNAVYKFYLRIIKEISSHDDDSFYIFLNQNYVAARNDYVGSNLEDYACKLFLDVSDNLICLKYA